MSTSRAKLQQALNRIEDRVPRLLKEHPGMGEFWPAFAALVEDLSNAAGTEDHEWLDDRSEALLSFHGIRARLRRIWKIANPYG